MKKVVFAIFAHPDDEAFGPCGTLLKEARDGGDVNLVMLTAGEAGINSNNVADLGEARKKEWQTAGKLLGASAMHFLGYHDGQLNNTLMIEIAERIEELVTETIKDSPVDTSVEFIAFDFSGLSGHIDHIVATRAACLAFYRLKQRDTRLARIRLYCLPASLYPEQHTDWIYQQPGCDDQNIDEIVDARDYRDDIIAIMRTHDTQRQDCDAVLKIHGDQLGLDHFMVLD